MSNRPAAARSEFSSPDPPPSAPPLHPLLRVQLSIMMFLQYAIWGAWLPILYSYLSGYRQFDGLQIPSIFAVGAIGAIIGPFIAGQIADRYFSTEKFLGISHLLGAALVWQLSWLDKYWYFLVFSLLYSLIYSPTLSLTNSLAFHHLPDRDRDFGWIRVWGTIGWIVVGIAVGQWLLHHYVPADQLAGKADAFRFSSVLGLVMGVFCFALPHTPPSPGREQNAVFEALGEIQHQPLLLLFLLAVPISCIHQFYFLFAADFLTKYQAQASGFVEYVNRIFGVGGGGLMTIGQMSEIVVLGLIPFVAKIVSRKSLLATGIVAYAVRMFLFAYVDMIHDKLGVPEIVTLMVGTSLHGFCFGCFIFVAFMIVDEETTGDIRASAQSLFNLVIVGVGTIVGSFISTRIFEWATTRTIVDDEVTKVTDYTRLFSVPMWAAVACLLILLLFYPRKSPAAA